MLLNVVHVCAQVKQIFEARRIDCRNVLSYRGGSGDSGGVKHGKLWRAQQLLAASKEGMYQ